MSSIDKKLDEVIKQLKSLEEFKSNVENIILMNTTLVQEISNQINTKIDILCNLENLSNNSNSSNSKSNKKSKSLTKTAFFKDKLKSNINEFLNILYTEDDIKNLYDNSEVKSKKTEQAKKNKIIDLLYNNITKNDENKHNKLKELFEDYKKNIDSASDIDEESKSEEN